MRTTLMAVFTRARLAAGPAAVMRATVAAAALSMTGSAGAQDDFKVIKLEQDVRSLERQVQDLSRQISDLQRRLSQSDERPAGATRTSPSAPTSTAWLDIANWNRVHPGMSELEVINLLGTPTSMRAEGDSRTLLYALEIGASGFLGGSVRLQDRKAVDVQKPVLR